MIQIIILTLIPHLQADQDGNHSLDYSEFVRVWDTIRGDVEVLHVFPSKPNSVSKILFYQDEKEIRKQFCNLDTDDSGFISKGTYFMLEKIVQEVVGDQFRQF